MRRIDVAMGGARSRTAFLRLALPVMTILLTLDHARGAGIGEGAISELREALSRVEDTESSADRRRICKRVIRKALSLLKKSPDAPNRSAALGVVFEGRRKLLEVDDSERNREALLETCRALSEAPDEHAAVRLPADALLAQIKVARSGDSQEEAEAAVTELVSRYGGTEAEAECLMTATVIAREIGSGELLKTYRDELSGRFSDSPRVKAFLRQQFGTTERDSVFEGRFTRADGSTLRLPVDRLGHPYVVCFWSEETDDLEERLLGVKAVREKYPGRFDVYSFNLDELPDCGLRTLRRLGLDWNVMRAPGGFESDVYLAYGHTYRASFAWLVVNERGYVRGRGYNWVHRNHKLPTLEDEVTTVLGSRFVEIRDPSRFALMRSLAIGDFLVTEPYGPTDALSPVELAGAPAGAARVLLGTPASVPADRLREIQACFPPPSVRCRLGREKALSNYAKAERLCAGIIESHPDAPHLFLARNRRIVALMGMWNLTGRAGHLERAAREAKTALEAAPPRGAGIVPRFCLARRSIREEPGDAEEIVASFIEGCGEEEAPGVAHAAAVLLALDAGDRDLYLKHRAIIMDRHAEDSRTWPVASVLLDRESARTLFEASGIYGYQYRHSGLSMDGIPHRVLRAELTTLDGEEIELPADTEGRHSIVVLVEPPADADDEKLQRELLAGFRQAVDDHRHKEMRLIVAFLTDDAASVKSLMARNRWSFEAACVPGGIDSPLAMRLGAFSTERLPKTYLVAPDGRIASVYEGLAVSRDYNGEAQSRDRRGTLFIFRSIKGVVRAYDVALGRKALSQQRYAEASRRLDISFPRKPVNGYNRSARYSLRANMALKNWEAALRDVDTVLKDPSWRHPSWRARDRKTREKILEHLKR